MRRNKFTLLCVLLLVIVLTATVCLAGCKDPEKKEAVITANSYQEFAYDGTEHKVQATLNHDETALTYDPAQGFTEIGEYKVTMISLFLTSVSSTS